MIRMLEINSPHHDKFENYKVKSIFIMFLKNLKVKNISIICIENAESKKNGSVLINRQTINVYF